MLPELLRCRGNKNSRIFWTAQADSESGTRKLYILNFWHDWNKSWPVKSNSRNARTYHISFTWISSSAPLGWCSDWVFWPRKNFLLEKFAADFFEVNKPLAFWYKLKDISFFNVDTELTSFIKAIHLFQCFYHFIQIKQFSFPCSLLQNVFDFIAIKYLQLFFWLWLILKLKTQEVQNSFHWIIH